MPTRAQLVERFAASDIDALNEVVASEEFTEEAKEIAREQLLSRGIAGPPMRGAGQAAGRRVPTEKTSRPGSPAALVNFWLVTRGLIALMFGLALFCLGASSGSSGIDLIAGGIGVSAAGAMMIWRRASLRWIAIASFVVAYGQLLRNALADPREDGWFSAVRWLPVLILSITSLLMIRTREELAAKTE